MSGVFKLDNLIARFQTAWAAAQRSTWRCKMRNFLKALGLSTLAVLIAGVIMLLTGTASAQWTYDPSINLATSPEVPEVDVSWVSGLITAQCLSDGMDVAFITNLDTRPDRIRITFQPSGQWYWNEVTSSNSVNLDGIMHLYQFNSRYTKQMVMDGTTRAIVQLGIYEFSVPLRGSSAAISKTQNKRSACR